MVDDSEDVRALVRRTLQSAAFDVVGEGGDGDEAILLAHRHEPDLLLLDASMPGVDGLEALPAILAMSPETTVVMFTGFEEPQLAARAFELGAVDLIQKSLPLEDLPGRLRRALGEARAGPSTGASVREAAGRRTPLGPGALSAETPADVLEQQALSQHVQQFRELFDRAEIGMATLTSSGTIVHANRALADLMDCDPFDLVGVDYGRLTVGRGDELDLRLDDLSTLGADLASFEHDLPVRAGEEPSRVVRVALAPIRDSHRHVLYVFAQVQDVTSQRVAEGELRRSEENFRRLVTAVREYAIFMLDTTGTVVSWNTGAQRIKGYTGPEIIGRHFRVFYPLEDQATGHPGHNLEMALRNGSYAEEGWRVRQDGSRFWASVVISAVYDDAGRHIGFAKVTRDLTQHRAHEEERQRLIDERIHLLAVTAHELRNPTAVIDGSAGALQAAWDQMSVDERTDLLDGIRASAERLRRLAADLGAASRSEGDTLPLQLEHVSLTEALRTAVTRRNATGTVVPIAVDTPREAVFLADPGRLGQALDNLIDNAIRHGAPPIGVTGTANDEVCIRVTDAGSGVPADLTPHLFERFAKSGATGGTGLGLYLVREIARRHGGDATYHPPVGDEPSAFEIRIPRRS